MAVALFRARARRRIELLAERGVRGGVQPRCGARCRNDLVAAGVGRTIPVRLLPCRDGCVCSGPRQPPDDRRPDTGVRGLRAPSGPARADAASRRHRARAPRTRRRAVRVDYRAYVAGRTLPRKPRDVASRTVRCHHSREVCRAALRVQSVGASHRSPPCRGVRDRPRAWSGGRRTAGDRPARGAAPAFEPRRTPGRRGRRPAVHGAESLRRPERVHHSRDGAALAPRGAGGDRGGAGAARFRPHNASGGWRGFRHRRADAGDQPGLELPRRGSECPHRSGGVPARGVSPVAGRRGHGGRELLLRHGHPLHDAHRRRRTAARYRPHRLRHGHRARRARRRPSRRRASTHLRVRRWCAVPRHRWPALRAHGNRRTVPGSVVGGPSPRHADRGVRRVRADSPRSLRG